MDIFVLWSAFDWGCADRAAGAGCSVGVDGVCVQTNQQRCVLFGMAIYCVVMLCNVFEWNDKFLELKFKNFVFRIANIQVFQPHFGNVIGAVTF